MDPYKPDDVEKLAEVLKKHEERKLEARAIEEVRTANYKYMEYHYDHMPSVYELHDAPPNLPKQFSEGVEITPYGDDYSGYWECTGYAYCFKSRQAVLDWLKLVGAKVDLGCQRAKINRFQEMANKENEIVSFFAECEK